MNSNYKRAPVVAGSTATGSGFGNIRTALNNNFEYIEDEFDNVRDEMNSSIIFGTYTGTGASERTINLGARPVAVEVYRRDGSQVIAPNGEELIYGGLAIQNHPCSSAITITNNGFNVRYDRSARIYTNVNNEVYYFKAYMSGITKTINS